MDNGTSGPKQSGSNVESVMELDGPTSSAAGSVPAATATKDPVPIGLMMGAKLPKIIPFTDLCRCGDEVWIEHDGQLYRLRRTRLGKLILTK